jgi:hypothetical protein
MFEDIVVVADFTREGDGTDNFDLPAFVDENVLGVNVTDLFFEVLELAACPNDVVEEIPDFGLQEIFFQLESV